MKRTKVLSALAICSAILLFSSCCTLGDCMGLSNKDNSLSIESSVPDAEVYINGSYVGRTPYQHKGTSANVKRITVKKDGFKEQTMKVKRKAKGSIYWNFYPSFTFIYGYFVDRANGCGMEYTEHYYHFNMEPK